MDATVATDEVAHRFDTLPSWDALMEWYSSLFEKQDIILEEFNRQIEMFFFQEVCDHFELELHEELGAAIKGMHTSESIMRIPSIVLCRTLEDNENRHLQRHGKQRRSAWNALLLKLHDVLDPLLRNGLQMSSTLALHREFLPEINERLDALLHRCEETLDRKTAATMDFDSRKSRIKRDMQVACSCAVYLSATEFYEDGMDMNLQEARMRLQVAKSMIDLCSWKRNQQEKQDLLDQLTESETRYIALQQEQSFSSLWSEAPSVGCNEPQIETCEIPAEKLRELEVLDSYDGIFPNLDFYLSCIGYNKAQATRNSVSLGMKGF